MAYFLSKDATLPIDQAQPIASEPLITKPLLSDTIGDFKPVPEKPESPCPGGFLRPNQGYCGEGYRETQDQFGNIWCCPVSTGVTPKTLACVNGYCQYVEVSIPELIAACAGKKEGDKCSDEWIEAVEPTPGDSPCQGGYLLSTSPIEAGKGSIWSDEAITPEMGFYRDPDAAGHWLHKNGMWFHRSDIVKAIESGTLDKLTGQQGGMCKKGTQPQEKDGQVWCCPTGHDFSGAGEGGTWAWPDEMNNLYQLMLELAERYGTPFEYGEDVLGLMGRMGRRGRQFMSMPFGFSEAARNAMFGRDYDVLRQAGQARGSEILDYLSSEGLTGTGAAQDVMTEQAWRTEQNISDLMRDLFVANEAQRRQDMYGYTDAAQRILEDLARLEASREQINLGRTGMVSNIFGQGMTYNAIIEEMNRARRGEQSQALAMLLSLLTNYMGAWG